MRTTARFTGSFARKAMLVAGSAVALAGVSTATASASAAPHAHDGAMARHTESAASRAAAQYRPVGGARRRSAYEPVRPKSLSWPQVQQIQAHRADPHLSAKSALPAADQLQPVAPYGPQETMQVTPAQYANATTIVQLTR